MGWPCGARLRPIDRAAMRPMYNYPTEISLDIVTGVCEKNAQRGIAFRHTAPPSPTVQCWVLCIGGDFRRAKKTPISRAPPASREASTLIFGVRGRHDMNRSCFGWAFFSQTPESSTCLLKIFWSCKTPMGEVCVARRVLSQ